MVTITISGAEKSGALARISALLVRKGYPLKGQQVMESPSGARFVKISLEGTQVDQDKLAAEIGGLSADYKVVDVEGAQSGVALIKEMADRFPDIVALVQAYGESFGSGRRDRELFQAGKKIGVFHYDKEWSFGSPLKMPVALRRSLVPALEKFGKVGATDTHVIFPDNPFRGGGKQVNCCHFVTGFMQGFLDAGPLTANTLVHKAACKAKGDPHCTYTMKYVL